MSCAARRSWLAAPFATLVLATACDDPKSLTPMADLAPTGGVLAAAVTSTGSDIDPDGYLVMVDANATTSQAVGPNGLATFTGLADGAHEVGLLGVAANCTVQANNPRAGSVTAAGATRFDVGCASLGNLFVASSTTGVDLDPDGYTVAVDGSVSQPVVTNGNVTFTGVATGSHAVALSGVAGNCTVSGANPQTGTVSAGGTASLAFSLSCAATGSGTGSLTVSTSTTGSNLDPDGYTVTLDGTSSQTIAINDAVTVTGPAGDHPVALSGVAANCTVSGVNPRTVTVPAGGTGSTTFAVTCSAQLPPPEVTGQGQLGMGSAAPGNYVQTLGFDVRADLTGRFTVTDYSNLHADGTPASMTTDASSDPATSITAYRTSSSACSDPSRGVEFDAWGRANDGDLLSYTVALCDNGPAGSGTDFVSLYIPSKGYGRSGSVTSGDIAKR